LLLAVEVGTGERASSWVAHNMTFFSQGMVTAFRQVIKAEGAGALLTGFGPTAIGYALQGAFKFGGYEFWKKTAIEYLGVEKASENRQLVYLGASGVAEFFADIALCPLEATRIRLVSQPTFATGLASGFAKIAKQEGFAGFYSGCVLFPFSPSLQRHSRTAVSFGPILFKQVPYTMAKFSVYESAFVGTTWHTWDLILIDFTGKTYPTHWQAQSRIERRNHLWS
jgi:solute carrier family 25 phosphate transporter 3